MPAMPGWQRVAWIDSALAESFEDPSRLMIQQTDLRDPHRLELCLPRSVRSGVAWTF